MKRPTTAREALIVEALGDVAELLDRVESRQGRSTMRRLLLAIALGCSIGGASAGTTLDGPAFSVSYDRLDFDNETAAIVGNSFIWDTETGAFSNGVIDSTYYTSDTFTFAATTGTIVPISQTTSS